MFGGTGDGGESEGGDLGSPGMVWGHQGWWGDRGWGFGVTRDGVTMFGGTEDRDIGVTMDGLEPTGVMGTPQMGIWGPWGWWGDQGWGFGVTRDGGTP